MLVTFGLFKKFSKEKDFKKEKDNFIFALKLFYSDLLGDIYETNKKKYASIALYQLDILIKKALKEKKKIDYDTEESLNLFLYTFGLLYKFLNKEKKKELLTIDYTYEGCKKFVLNIYDEYIKEAKQNIPKEIDICLEERGFVSYCHLNNKNINKKNYFELIRNYFILDDYNNIYKKYRDNNLYNTIRDYLIDIYPNIEEENGIFNKIGNFLNYIGLGKKKELLNEDYNKKNNNNDNNNDNKNDNNNDNKNDNNTNKNNYKININDNNDINSINESENNPFLSEDDK